MMLQIEQIEERKKYHRSTKLKKEENITDQRNLRKRNHYGSKKLVKATDRIMGSGKNELGDNDYSFV